MFGSRIIPLLSGKRKMPKIKVFVIHLPQLALFVREREHAGGVR